MQQVAGRYDLQDVVGAGGMAEVWRARDRRLDRDVAVKLLHRGGLRDAATVARFTREAQIVARLSHPNIVALYDAGAARRGHLVTSHVPLARVSGSSMCP